MSERLDLVLDPIGWKILSAFEPMPFDATVKLGETMRKKGLDPDLISAVTTQLNLRYEARKKFGTFADDLIFTRAGMEQASRLQVAALHADRFRRAGCHSVADLGCGIGIDSYAMAGLGIDVIAVDMNEVALSAATVNLRFFDNATTRLADVTTLDVSELGVDGIFADPARRNDKGRVNDPEQWSPRLGHVMTWVDQVKGMGVKVSPAIDYNDLRDDCRVVWTSVDGELLEACLWFGECAYDGPGRTAMALKSDGRSLTIDVTDTPTPSTPPVMCDPAPQIGDYIFEPDPAFIRAGALARLCDLLDAAPVGPGIAYLTGNRLPPDDMAAFIDTFRVIDTSAFKGSAMRQMVQSHEFSQLDIKKRGVDATPSSIRHQIFGGKGKQKKSKKRSGTGNLALTLICTPTAEHRRAILTERVVCQ